MGTVESSINLKEDLKGDVLVLRIKGRLDALASPIIEKRIFNYIDQGHVKLVFDFSEVSYLSSAGMRMLLSITKKLHSLSGRLIICSLSTNVSDVLKMSGFDHVLEVSSTESDALSCF